MIKQDKAALTRLLADDMLYSHANGSTQTKAEYVEAVPRPPARYESFTDSQTNVEVYGKAAVVEVYVLNNGIWQMTAHQWVCDIKVKVRQPGDPPSSPRSDR